MWWLEHVHTHNTLQLNIGTREEMVTTRKKQQLWSLTRCEKRKDVNNHEWNSTQFDELTRVEKKKSLILIPRHDASPIQSNSISFKSIGSFFLLCIAVTLHGFHINLYSGLMHILSEHLRKKNFFSFSKKSYWRISIKLHFYKYHTNGSWAQSDKLIWLTEKYLNKIYGKNILIKLMVLIQIE